MFDERSGMSFELAIYSNVNNISYKHMGFTHVRNFYP